MSNVKDFFTKENTHKIFLCNMKYSTETKRLQCYYDIDYDRVEAYSWDDARDPKDYLEHVDSVIEEVLFEDDFVPTKDETELSTDDISYLDNQRVGEDLYEYDSKEQLDKLIKLLRVHIVEGCEDSEYGLLYYYSQYDDFDCYGDGWTHYVKIIDKARIC